MTANTDPAVRAAERIVQDHANNPRRTWEDSADAAETIIREEYAELLAERDAMARALRDLLADT